MNNITVRQFTAINKNKGVKWAIDKEVFISRNSIPDSIMDRRVMEWDVNPWKNIVYIRTYM